ncbi:cryptochrome/photolyase family protein [Blastopirellula marina]|uniref:Cryptochrome/photolyase family protein n=1 Tax=Blastopirellula marina TaxID=124 RepID=A0A2S8G0P3_9BACT|nr:cryptochrome/photolyase family protein [Blastopirellula marina]PQO38007.1 cryptochrome/photolyase family protein [Blastopirellula marina]PTL44663.1 cryptochrome/photolyase family protein [Blastopirellula marina]
MRHLLLILGDQLDRDSAIFDGYDPKLDQLWMAESEHEITYVPSHKQRIVLFLAAMRHFRDELNRAGRRVTYHPLNEDQQQDRGQTFADLLRKTLKTEKPKAIRVVLPGDYRVKRELESVAQEHGVPLDILPDLHFYATVNEFHKFARRRKSLLLETFYRQMRKKHDLLMVGNKPMGGQWNYDHDNREPLPKAGPGEMGRPTTFSPDETTREVINLVEARYRDHPGKAEDFDLPVTPGQAQRMLADFVRKHLSDFGRYEDAMWTDEPFLHHSRLSTSLNLKLLNPRECVRAAVEAYQSGSAPLASVEGFVRQIVGWREFIRGIYWTKMPDYAELNGLNHQATIPSFFWDGQTDMRCIGQSLQHVLRYGYVHHIQRLMVLGNLSITLGVDPYAFHQWHMAMYLDAVDWVSLPNTLGMSQHGDGGIVGTKPYASTGNYIHKMSNFCGQCPYDYRKATGDDACPLTTFYWDFLDRHYDQLSHNPRMKLQLKHVEKKRASGEIESIRQHAETLRKKWQT